jgi:hypothetical protein
MFSKGGFIDVFYPLSKIIPHQQHQADGNDDA